MYIEMKKEEAIKFFGKQAQVARELGISRQAVFNWDKYVPSAAAFEIYLLSDKKLGTVINSHKTRRYIPKNKT